MGAGEGAVPGVGDSGGDAAQVDRGDHGILAAGGGEGRDAQRPELAEVAIAAQPGILSGDLGIRGRRRDVEVVGNRTAAAGGLKASQEAPGLALAMRRV